MAPPPAERRPLPCDSHQDVVREISRCRVRPRTRGREETIAHPTRCELSTWDVSFLSVGYINKGLLFSIPSVADDIDSIVDRLKDSLSLALHRYYPLAGRFATEGEPQSLVTYVDCSDQGAELVRALAKGVTISDVLQPPHTPPLVWSFFSLRGAINHDGHVIPLLSLQITELTDGVFLGFSFNHSVGDGTSFWNFVRDFADISRRNNTCTAGEERLLLHERWFIDGKGGPYKLPFNSLEEHIERYIPATQGTFRERVFHFSAESVAELKRRANVEGNVVAISSFQALAAHVWRSITRARSQRQDSRTRCYMACNTRTRLIPPLPPSYFGNAMKTLDCTATAGELAKNGIGWAAELLHQTVVSCIDAAVRRDVKEWMVDPIIVKMRHVDAGRGSSILMSSSPRFEVYGCDFGWREAVGVRSGSGNKFDGKVTSYPGKEGGGSVDLEICLLPEVMSKLEMDDEFMGAVSIRYY